MARFIPACAGNTQHTFLLLTKRAVHPRVCGEHLLISFRRDAMTGSSPRVRGTQWGTFFELDMMRFIPACAGNTRFPVLCSLMESVHPRVCGEHVIKGGKTTTDNGSSPRVRGTPQVSG